MEFVANNQPPEVLQPREKTFDLPSSPVTAKRSAVLRLGSFPPPPVRGDHLGTPVLAQPLIKAVAVVRLVPDQAGGHFVGESGVESPLDKRHFMRRSAGHVHGDRKTRSVCHCHDLAALAPLGFAHGSAPFLAGANVPSMKASRRSMPPRSRRSSATATSMLSKTPCSRHRWNQRWQVWYGGYRSGKSFHGAPVLRIQRMPSNTSRGGVEGLPLPPCPPLAGGTRGAMRSHCSFVRSMWTGSDKTGRKSRNFLDFSGSHF